MGTSSMGDTIAKLKFDSADDVETKEYNKMSVAMPFVAIN